MLQVANCTGGVAPIAAAQSVSTAALGAGRLVFDVFATSAAATRNNTCTVTLLDSQVSSQFRVVCVVTPCNATLFCAALHTAAHFSTVQPASWVMQKFFTRLPWTPRRMRCRIGAL